MNSSLDRDHLQATLKAAKEELRSLQAERARLEAQINDVLVKIDRRNELIRLTTELRQENQVPVSSIEQTLGLSIEGAGAAEDFDAPAMLAKFPRDGYGAITRAVEALLKTNDIGYTAKWLSDQLEAAKFVVADLHETAVRSALKNLRNQKKVAYNDNTRRYHLISEAR